MVNKIKIIEKKKRNETEIKNVILKNYLFKFKLFIFMLIVAIHTMVLANADQVSEEDAVTNVKQISGAIQMSNVIHAIAI